MIHLDTNFLIQATVSGSAAHVQIRTWASAGFSLGISAVVWAEFLCGPLDATATILAAKVFPNPEPFLAADAELASRLFNLTGRRSRSLADCMIAATAMRCGAKVATSNTADFQPFETFGLFLV